ncbi:histidine phosphatase family protein [Streptacidiphilus carbonis]|uniref:histidine phosphatase family protein n=1 Tax=Streptacidiphilus carbonis TaxID=105422 RepID=UPI0005A94A5E|nr:histidine phosphatase family protein [Streptacidiphilus carbonis]
MPSRILLVRHGETAWSASGRHTGRTDIPLTEEGREMARRLGDRLKREPWGGLPEAEIRTSPLLRARETCELAGFGERAVDAPDLLEWDYGSYEGMTGPAIRAGDRPGWLIWRDGVPGGETLEQVAARADAFIDWTAEHGGVPDPGTTVMHSADSDVVVFAHGHFLRILTARWLGLPATHGQRLKLGPATLSILTWEYGARAVELWNDGSHLR